MSMTFKVQDAVYGGFVLARDEGVIFVKGAIPGETVEVEVKEKKRDYTVAQTINVVEPSTFRVEPECQYFGDCGGCQLQFASYEKQVAMKNSILLDCLRRIAGIEAELSPPLFGKPFGYRRRAQFKVSREGHIGFYREGTHDVVPIEACPLMVDEINELLNKLSVADLAGVREVHVTAGATLEVLIKGIPFSEADAERFMSLGLDCVAFDDHSYLGTGYVELDLSGLRYTVSPLSFFQSNWDLNCRVARSIAEEYSRFKEKNILDLYAGAGNFSLLMAHEANTITAVEENPFSTKDGHRNVKLNKLKKYKFVKGRAEDAAVPGEFDLLLLDPPRPGLSKVAMRRVLQLKPQHIAYVSCNPSTFARDLKALSETYDLKSVQMVDMFPNTYHVESLAFLVRTPRETVSPQE